MATNRVCSSWKLRSALLWARFPAVERTIVTDRIRPLKIDEATKERLRILFIAKHALWGGGLHPEDGNHTVYHVEVRTILQGRR